jgi:CRISPR/Cas system-associated endonuclease Cas1
MSLDISNDAVQIFCSFYLFRTKRVYTEYGRFYVVVRKDKLHLYQDRLFYLKYIDHQWYSSMENTKEWVKKQCDATTRSQRVKDEILKSVKEWNGCVDLQTERDKKLDKLIN